MTDDESDGAANDQPDARHPLLPPAPKTRDERLELTAIGFGISTPLIAVWRGIVGWGGLTAAHEATTRSNDSLGHDLQLVLALGDGGRMAVLLAFGVIGLAAAYGLRRPIWRIGIPVTCLALMLVLELVVHASIMAVSPR